MIAGPSTHKVLFTPDVQALSLFRILLGLLLLADYVGGLGPHFAQFFTDSGILPHSLDVAVHPGIGRLSLLDGLTQPWQQGLFKLVYLGGIVFFTLGYRTDWAKWVLLICNISLYNRNIMLTSGTEMLIRLFLLWSLFVPLNRYWSVDSALRRGVRDVAVPQALMAGIKVQVAFLYFFSGIYKVLGAPWREGIAPAHAMVDGVFGSPAGEAIVPHLLPVMPFLSWGIILFQLTFSLLVYCPVWNNITRSVALLGAIAMHGSFIFLLHVGMFPYLCLAYLVLIVPDSWWNAFFARRRARLEKITLYFQPDCGFCEKTALLFRELCLSPHTSVLPASANGDALALLRQHNSWVVTDSLTGKSYLKWQAVAFVLRQNPFTWLAGVITDMPFLKKAGAAFYDLIGRSRPLLGRVTALALPFDEKNYAPSPLAGGLCVFMLALALAGNVMYLPPVQEYVKLPKIIADAIRVSQTYQRWNLFAPEPPHEMMEYSVTGTTEAGNTVDLTGAFERILTLHKEGYHLLFDEHRWLKFFSRLLEPKYERVAKYFLYGMCKDYRPADDAAHAYLKSVRLELRVTMIMLPPDAMEGVRIEPYIKSFESDCVYSKTPN